MFKRILKMNVLLLILVNVWSLVTSGLPYSAETSILSLKANMKLYFWTSSSLAFLAFQSSNERPSEFRQLVSDLQLEPFTLYINFYIYRFSCVCVAEPAAPRSVYAVNATHSAVTLLWSEEGVVDYYQVLCKANKPSKELKVRTTTLLIYPE